MPDYVASTPPLTINGALLAVPLLPLVGALGFLVLALVTSSGVRTARAVSRVWAAGPTGAAALVLAGLWARAAMGGAGVMSGGLPIVLAGSLDWSLTLVLDGIAGPFAIAGGLTLACGLAAIARAPIDGSRKAAALAAGNASAAALYACLLAEGGALFLLASSAALACAFVAASLAWRAHGTGTIGLSRFVGDAFVAAGLAIAFWAFGGTWTSQDFAGDVAVRVAPIRNAEDAAKVPQPVRTGASAQPAPAKITPGQQGSLTMTTSPGAKVYLDNSRTPWQIAPFAGVPIGAGPHDVKIDLGSGADEHDLHVVHVPPAGDTRFGLIGPTFGFREMSDQLSLDPISESGKAVRARLGTRSIFRAPALLVAWLLVIAGAAARAGGWPFHASMVRSGEAAPGRWLEACIGVLCLGYVLTRVAPLALTQAWPFARGCVVTLGLLSALAASLLARAAREPAAAWRAAALAQTGFVVAAAGAGAGVAVVVFAIGVVATGAAACVAPRLEAGAPSKGARNAHALACLSLGAAPGLASFWALASLFLALSPGSASGLALTLLTLAAAVALASALAKTHTLALSVAKPKRERSRASRSSGASQGPGLAAVLLTVTTCIGLLGAEPAYALAGRHSPIGTWLERSGVRIASEGASPSVAFAMALLASLFAFLARSAFASASANASDESVGLGALAARMLAWQTRTENAVGRGGMRIARIASRALAPEARGIDAPHAGIATRGEGA